MQEQRNNTPISTKVKKALSKEEFIFFLKNQSGSLLALGRNYLGNNEDAKDALQETSIKLFKKRHEIHTSLQSMAMKIMENTCIDMLKKRNTRPKALNKLSLSDLSAEMDIKVIDWNKYVEQVTKEYELGSLSKQEKIAIIYKSEGYSAPEIARFMNEDGFQNMTAYKVNKTIERTRKKLKKLDVFVNKRKKNNKL